MKIITFILYAMIMFIVSPLSVIGETVSFIYDGDGSLVAKRVQGEITVATQFVGGVYEKEVEGGTQKIKCYSFGNRQIAHKTASELRYIHPDHLGSAGLQTDGNGVKEYEAHYYPFGEHRISSGDNPGDRDFTGQKQIGEICLLHYESRFYDPLTGHFVSADSIVPGEVHPQAYNRFSYVYNNPLGYIDPTGHIGVPTGLPTPLFWLLGNLFSEETESENDSSDWRRMEGLPPVPPPTAPIPDLPSPLPGYQALTDYIVGYRFKHRFSDTDKTAREVRRFIEGVGTDVDELEDFVRRVRETRDYQKHPVRYNGTLGQVERFIEEVRNPAGNAESKGRFFRGSAGRQLNRDRFDTELNFHRYSLRDLDVLNTPSRWGLGGPTPRGGMRGGGSVSEGPSSFGYWDDDDERR
jgi:RHS repeat-associated protein